MKSHDTKKVGILLLILTGIEIIIFTILKNTIICNLSKTVEFWSMVFPWLTTLLCSVWFLTGAMRSKHPRRSLAIRISFTYLWCCAIGIGIVILFYPIEAL